MPPVPVPSVPEVDPALQPDGVTTRATEVVRQQKKGAQNITVAVRVRPLTQVERDRHAYPTTKVLDHEHVLVSDPDDKMGGIDYLRLDKTKTKHYCFDHSFGPEALQTEVYARTAKELVPRVVEGYNACCFAYGATGAGKTFTMMGNLESSGVIPQTLEELMQQAHAHSRPRPHPHPHPHPHPSFTTRRSRCSSATRRRSSR